MTIVPSDNLDDACVDWEIIDIGMRFKLRYYMHLPESQSQCLVRYSTKYFSERGEEGLDDHPELVLEREECEGCS